MLTTARTFVKKCVEYSSYTLAQTSQIPLVEAVIGFPDEFRPFVSHLLDFFGAAFGIYVVCRVILRTLPAKVSYMGVYF